MAGTYGRISLVVLSAAVLLVLFSPFIGMSCAQEARLQATGPKDDASLRNEIQHAIEKGLQWLMNRQDVQGFWSQAEHPALTGLVLTAAMGEPSGQIKANPPEQVRKGYEYLLKCIQPDGGIYVKDLANYNTAVSTTALVLSYNPSYDKVLRNARNFLVGLQQDYDEKGKTDNPFDGGIGYGSSYTHSDMSNTMFALEAIHYTRFLSSDKPPGSAELKDLNWGAAVKFMERCQNLPGTNDQPWASDDPQNRGGFIYFPGDSKAGEMQLPSGKTALRSYASISYAGLLSYIYADLDRNDPRVQAVYDWLRRNYTLEENPGLQAQGLYYYYHTMAKALSAYGAKSLALEDGREVNWRKELALKLLNLQNGDGYWVNENGRWWEKDPVLVTSYALISLEILQKGL